MLLYWLIGPFLEGRKVVEEVLAAPGEISEQARARLRTVDGLLAALLTDLATAQAQLGEALAWFEGHDDDEGSASALCGLGIATAPFDSDRARTLFRESARLFAVTADAWGEAIVLGALGWLDTGRGDFEEEAVFERAYELARYVDDDVSTAHSATNLAELRLAQGRPGRARDVLEIALTRTRPCGSTTACPTGSRLPQGSPELQAVQRRQRVCSAAADGLRTEVGVPIWGARGSPVSRRSSPAPALGSEIFASAWAEGRALDYDAALEHARRALCPTGLNVSSSPDHQPTP